jgi:hypothetical protein
MSIGHKRIEQFDNTHCIRIRLIIQDSIAEPVIKTFSAFFVEP